MVNNTREKLFCKVRCVVKTPKDYMKLYLGTKKDCERFHCELVPKPSPAGSPIRMDILLQLNTFE